MFCKVCGGRIPEGTAFCANCGASSSGTGTRQQNPPPQQPPAGARPAAAAPAPQYAPPQYAPPQYAPPAPLQQQPQTPYYQGAPPGPQAPPQQYGPPPPQYGGAPPYQQPPQSPQAPLYAPYPAAVAAPLYVTCLSGPDAGKFYTILGNETIMGRSTGIGQVDPTIAPQHVAVCAVNHRLRFRSVSQWPIYVNAQPALNGELLPGQEFRLGTSIWKVNVAPGQHSANLLQSLQDRLNQLAGTEKLEGFSLRDMFSEVFKKRTSEELEDYLTVGTYRTTPAIEKAQTGWPKPWLFMRVLIAVIGAYIGFVIIMTQFHNLKAVPAVILMGSLAVPLATVFLFFELNTPRNVSFYKIWLLVAVGGMVSLLVAVMGYDIPVLGQLGPLSPGIIEEVAKLATVVLVVRQATRYKYILNGMLFGASVGVGFAVFESAGYAFEVLLGRGGGIDVMSSVIHLRALLSPFGHVAWTAIAAGALWRVKKDQPLKAGMFFDPKFLRAFLIPVVLHTLWDTDLPSPFFIKHILLGVVSWYVVFAMVQQGLRQVKADQVRTTQITLKSLQAVA